MLACQFSVTVLARTGIAARVRVARAWTGKQWRRRYGNPRSIRRAVAPNSLTPRPAGAIVLGRRSVPLTDTHVGVSDDPFAKLPDCLLKAIAHVPTIAVNEAKVPHVHLGRRLLGLSSLLVARSHTAITL